MKTSIRFVASLAAATWLSGTATAVELISNGNFETFSGGLPTAWTYTQGDGPSTLQNSANSPFTNIYPAGSNDLLFTDTSATGLSPFILQNFSSQTGTIYASWDFNLASTTGNNWIVQIDDSVTAALRFNMDYTAGTFAYESNATTTPVISLTSNTWYQVLLTLDIATDTFSGTITPFGGSPTAFGGGFRVPVPTLDRFLFIDISNGDGSLQNANIQLDNVSVNTEQVPEPSTVILALTGIGLMAIRKFRRR